MVEKRQRDEIDEILFHIDNKKNFVLSGGAGSGKTYSLVQTLKRISVKYPAINIACITYTNAAAIEVKNRANIKHLKVSTIHDFLWDIISQFQREMKITLSELINNPEQNIPNPNDDGHPFEYQLETVINYKEYISIKNGIISHDEVIILAHAMFSKYIKLCDLVNSMYGFIFVDEFQDTSPLVIELLLSYLARSSIKCIVGFFGDTMQSIYETGVGDISTYVAENIVSKIEKKQNRRNPLSIINLANKIRTDGLIQEPSSDASAPNMIDGTIKQGSVNFLYSDDFDLNLVKKSSWCSRWDFSNSKKTKELRLTHNLIANEAGFAELMSVYDADPIFNFKRDFSKYIKTQNIEVDVEDSFDNVVSTVSWVYSRGDNKGRHHKDVFLDDYNARMLYDHIKDWPYKNVQKIYLDKDNLIDDKVVVDGVTLREPKRDRLIQHLFKIQEVILMYNERKYNEVIRKISLKINKVEDKMLLKTAIDSIVNSMSFSIGDVISYADKNKICIIDDNLTEFINENEYLYWRVKDIQFRVFQNLYKYLEGYVPLSTQHKIKGLEFEHVLVVLHNGGWSNYNFEYLINPGIKSSLSSSRQQSFDRILDRTQKLFYVCCTRAKEELVVYCPSPTTEMIDGALNLFGVDNVHKINS